MKNDTPEPLDKEAAMAVALDRATGTHGKWADEAAGHVIAILNELGYDLVREENEER